MLKDPRFDIEGCIAIFLASLIFTSIMGFCVGIMAGVFGGLIFENPILGIEPALFVTIVTGGIVAFGLYIPFCKKNFSYSCK